MSKKHKTIYPGVRFREHPRRRYSGKSDRYFFIRYRLNGNLREEGLGWASEGWSAKSASLILAKLKESHVSGDGPQSLAEKREIKKEQKERERIKKEKEARERRSFGDIFLNDYLPDAKSNKDPQTCRREESLFRLKISPVIGSLALADVAPFHLEQMKKKMSDAGAAPRSIRYALAVVRQVFNFSRRNGLFNGDSPTSKVKMPQSDNRRLRFLSHEEADRLLESLERRSIDLYEMALLSLHSGMRAGEIFSLTWGDVDLKRGIISLRDTKSGKNRIAFMTETARKILVQEERGENDDLVFPGRGGVKINHISKTFDEVVKDIGLNEGVTDPRRKAVFHTLRHTYASWLVESGVDLYTIKELLGHSTIALTERYSHLGNNTLQNAMKVLDKSIKRKTPKKSETGKKDRLHQNQLI